MGGVLRLSNPLGLAFIRDVALTGGTQLVQAGLAAAQAQQREVIPQCSMFAQYMRKRPETHSMLAPAGRALLHM